MLESSAKSRSVTENLISDVILLIMIEKRRTLSKEPYDTLFSVGITGERRKFMQTVILLF